MRDELDDKTICISYVSGYQAYKVQRIGCFLHWQRTINEDEGRLTKTRQTKGKSGVGARGV